MRTIVAIALLLAGCRFDPPEDNPGPETCEQSHDTCVCLQPQGVCVECTVDEKRNCTADKPTCGNENLCRGCRADSDCESSACLEDGSCADESRVIYAKPNGVNTTGCGLQAGQNECSITQALLEINGLRDIVRLAPGSYGVTAPAGLNFTQSATLIARSATVINRASGTGPIMTVQAQQTLTLVGGTLRGPNTADGIRCDNGTLRVFEATIEEMSESGIEGNACILNITRSKLHSNLRGGINMTGDAKVAEITNNFIYNNGQNISSIGGMLLRLEGASKIEFNTVVDNLAFSTGGGGGVECYSTNNYDAPRNLIFRNRGGIGEMVQVIGTCTFAGSYVQYAPSSDNSVGFKDPNPLNPDYHLTDRSPVGTILDGVVCTGVDFDLDPRPLGGSCDFGADEFRPGP